MRPCLSAVCVLLLASTVNAQPRATLPGRPIELHAPSAPSVAAALPLLLPSLCGAEPARAAGLGAAGSIDEALSGPTEGEGRGASALDGGDRTLIVFEARFLPYLLPRTDLSDRAYVKDTGADEADAQHGPGWAIRAGVGGCDCGDGHGGVHAFLGVSYLRTSHELEESIGTLETHGAFLEAWGTVALTETDVTIVLGGGLGVGGVVLDFTRGYDDTGGAALKGELTAGVGFLDRLELRATFGGIVAGYPSNTTAYVTYVGLDIGISF